jgi:predicted DNA-binding transcriptional regulator AlpA
MNNSEERVPNDVAAEILGVKPVTLVGWRNERRGPAYLKIGKRVYYRRADIETWISAQRCEPEAA